LMMFLWGEKKKEFIMVFRFYNCWKGRAERIADENKAS